MGAATLTRGWPGQERLALDAFTSGKARDLLTVIREREGQGRRPEGGVTEAWAGTEPRSRRSSFGGQCQAQRWAGWARGAHPALSRGSRLRVQAPPP